MQFRIIESQNNPNEYEEWIKLYNEGVQVKQIQKQLNINNTQHRKYRKQALEEGRVVDRRSNKKHKHYYRINNGSYVVIKRNQDGKPVYYGCYKDVEKAMEKVETLS